MKTTFYKLIPALLFLISFCGCGGNPPCDDCNTPNDTTNVEKWIWMQNVTLDLYPKDNKLYSTIIAPSNIIIMFLDDNWLYYKMVGDTMYIRGEGYDFPAENDSYGKFLILQHTEEFLEMKYLGITTGNCVTYYLFNRQN